MIKKDEWEQTAAALRGIMLAFPADTAYFRAYATAYEFCKTQAENSVTPTVWGVTQEDVERKIASCNPVWAALLKDFIDRKFGKVRYV